MPLLARVNRAAGFLSGRLSVVGFDTQMVAAVETFTHDIVASSEIEGVSLNTDQVRSSVARRMGVTVPNETESSHYVDGVVEMMLDAMGNYRSPLTADRLFGWHCCLFPNGRSGMEVINVGKYRVDEMEVVSGTWGRSRVHYRAPEAAAVSAEMQRFLCWFNSDQTANSYIKSAVAHFWFVSIHPFDDGNGRIGRAIADMALSQADDSRLRFFSMSQQICKDKRKYNNMLETCQKGGCDITQWVVWYLECMERSIANADKLLSSILDKSTFWLLNSALPFSERQRAVLNAYLDGYRGKLTVKNWAKLAKVSADTASRDIKDLESRQVLVVQKGRVRDAFYGIRIKDSNIYLPGPVDADE